MSNRNNSGSNKPERCQKGSETLRLLRRQSTLLEEATSIDEKVFGCPPELTAQHARLVEKGDQLREQARHDLCDQLGRHATQATTPHFAAVGLLAAGFAQSNAGTPFEDPILAQVASTVLERFVADCKSEAMRNCVEDLLNVAHRRAALVESPAPKGPATRHDPAEGARDPEDATPPAGAPDIFGLSTL